MLGYYSTNLSCVLMCDTIRACMCMITNVFLIGNIHNNVISYVLTAEKVFTNN